MDKDKGNKKKPLKLSSSGRLQIRKNLGPAGDKARNNGNKKTIQIVFKNKNNQQKSQSLPELKPSLSPFISKNPCYIIHSIFADFTPQRLLFFRHYTMPSAHQS